MAEGITLKRIIDMDEATELTSSDYALVDSATGGPKKFALGDELSSLKDDINVVAIGEYPVSIIPNKYINVQTGEEATYNGWSATDFIPIASKLKIISPNSMPYSALYDVNKRRISTPTIRAGINYYDPSDGAYIRLSDTSVNVSKLRVYTLNPFDAEYIDEEIENLVGYKYQTSLNFKRGSYVNIAGCRIDDISIAMNGVSMDNDALKKRLRLSGNEYSHDSTFLDGGDGMIYCVYTISANANHDSPGWQDARVELSKTANDYNSFSPSQSVTVYPVAKNSDRVGNATIISGCGVANMVKIGSATLRIIFSAQLDDGKWYELYRDYNITDGSMGNIGVCRLNSADFTSDNLLSSLGITENPDFLSLNAQIASDGETFYLGACIKSIIPNGVIISTQDMITFNIWLIPTEITNSSALFEAACYIKSGYLYYALRQVTSTFTENEKHMILCKINLTNKTITDQCKIYDTGSRPFWYEENNVLYLLHSISNRDRLEIIEVNEDRIGSSKIVCHGGIFQCSYPSIIKDENGFWICSTSNGFTQVYLRQFKTFNAYSVTDAHSLLVGLLRLNN